MSATQSTGIAIEHIRLPRHIAALNALAENCSLSVEVIIEPYEGETANNILAKWTGTKEQLFAVGLFTPTQQRLPVSRGMIVVPSTINWHRWPLLRGYVSVQGPGVVYEVDFGHVPRCINTRGDLEVAEYDGAATYHGTAEALLRQGVCRASQLPLGKVRWNRDYPHGPGYEGLMWYSRRQPDGTILHWLETEAARVKRVAEYNNQMGSCLARSRTAISRLADVYEAGTASAPGKPTRSNHLRLVVSNDLRKESQS